MRLVWYCATLLWLLWEATSVPAKVISVPHNDGSIQYMPSTCDLDCTRVCKDQWWLSCLSSGSSHRTKGNNTSANFVFKGSSVTWFTRVSTDGGPALVYLDGGDQRSVDTNSPITVESKGMATYSGLDPSKEHMISILYDYHKFVDDRLKENFVDVHHFEYDDGSDTGGTNGGTDQQKPPTGGTTTTTTTSSSSHNNPQNDPGKTSTTTTGSTTSSTGTTISGTGTSTHSSGGTGPFVIVTGPSGVVTVFQGNGDSSQESAAVNNTSPDTQTAFDAPIAAIVGGVLGFVLLVVAVVFFMCYRRRKTRELAAIRRADPFNNAGFGVPGAFITNIPLTQPPPQRVDNGGDDLFSQRTLIVPSGVGGTQGTDEKSSLGLSPLGFSPSSISPTEQSPESSFHRNPFDTSTAFAGLSRDRGSYQGASSTSYHPSSTSGDRRGHLRIGSLSRRHGPQSVSSGTRMTDAGDDEYPSRMSLGLSEPMTPPPRYATLRSPDPGFSAL